MNTSLAYNVGLAMALVTILYSFFNAVRATRNPVGFARAFGVPASSRDAFVSVYGIRTLFIALYGLALLVSGQPRALALFALVAAVMPILDLVLVWQHGAPVATRARHAAIAVFLLLTAFLVNLGT
jgi:hypothetical protein